MNGAKNGDIVRDAVAIARDCAWCGHSFCLGYQLDAGGRYVLCPHPRHNTVATSRRTLPARANKGDA